MNITVRLVTGTTMVATIATLAAVSGCAASGTQSAGAEQKVTPATQKAYQKCKNGFAKTLTLADKGHTLIVDTENEYDFEGLGAYECVTGALGTPARITSSIETTTSLMGRQTGRDKGLSYEWSYHPDNGLFVLITDKKKGS
jgi:hypothetical protein